MSPDQAIKVRGFAIQYIEKHHSRSRKETKAQCHKLLNALIPDNITEETDSFDVLSWENWGWGTKGRSPKSFWKECRDWTFWGRVYSERVIQICEFAFEEAMENFDETGT